MVHGTDVIRSGLARRLSVSADFGALLPPPLLPANLSLQIRVSWIRVFFPQQAKASKQATSNKQAGTESPRRVVLYRCTHRRTVTNSTRLAGRQGRRSARYHYLIIGPGPFFIRGRWIIKALGARQTAQGAPTYVAVGNSPEQVPDPRPNRCGTLDITT